MEKTYVAVVAFENCHVGDQFSVDETPRLQALVAMGYLREIVNPFLGVELADSADLTEAVAAMQARPRSRRSRSHGDGDSDSEPQEPSGE